MEKPEAQNNTASDSIEIARALPESPDTTARQRRREGDGAFKAGDLEAAVSAYRTAIAADADNIRAHHNLGGVFYTQADWEGARF